jgi:hypothetical protein
MLLWNEDIKNEFTFSIWSCELIIMAHKKVRNQIGNLILYHKTHEIGVKWFSNWTCDMLLKMSFQSYDII